MDGFFAGLLGFRVLGSGFRAFRVYGLGPLGCTVLGLGFWTLHAKL